MDDYTLYDVLGVDPTASTEEIVTAHRRVARSLHPDTSGNPATTQLFRMVQRARDVLNDPVRRAEYDRMLSARPHPAQQRATPGPAEARTVDAAIQAFVVALSAAAETDADQFATEVTDLQRHWAGPRALVGSVADITAVLRSNLNRDAGRPGFSSFLIELLDDRRCVQVASVFAGQRRAVAYRVWNTPGDSLALLGSTADTLTRPEPGDTSPRDDTAPPRPAPPSAPGAQPPAGAAASGPSGAGRSRRRHPSLITVLLGLGLVVVVLAVVIAVSTHVPAGDPSRLFSGGMPPAPPRVDATADGPRGRALPVTTTALNGCMGDRTGHVVPLPGAIQVPCNTRPATVDTSPGTVHIGDPRDNPNDLGFVNAIAPDGTVYSAVGNTVHVRFPSLPQSAPAVNLPSDGVEDLAVAPDGRFVVATTSKTVPPGEIGSGAFLIDTATFSVTPLAADREIYSGRLNVAISPDSRWVYLTGAETFASHGLPLVQVVNVADRTATDVPLPPPGSADGVFAPEQWDDVALSPDGRFLYGFERADDQVDLVDTATNTMLWRLDFGPIFLDFLPSADGRYLYVLFAKPGFEGVQVYTTGASPQPVASAGNLPLTLSGKITELPDGHGLAVTYGDERERISGVALIDTSSLR